MEPTQLPDKLSTLVFLRRNEEVVLAMKKRDLGKGKWNGAGGKVNPDESVLQAAIRETKEEIGVTPIKLEQTALLNIYYIDKQQPEVWEIHVFICTEWEGEPQESEEMRPQWFKLDNLPFQDMWPDDNYWLLKALTDEKVIGDFIFRDGKILSYKMAPMPSPNPLAVTIICINEDGDLLLKNRTKEPDKGKWELIGGHVKTGERLIEAVQRILQDKVNIHETLSIEFTGHYYDDPNRHPGNPCLPLTFKVRTPNAHLKEIKNASWFEPKLLSELEYALDDKQMLLDIGIL